MNNDLIMKMGNDGSFVVDEEATRKNQIENIFTLTQEELEEAVREEYKINVRRYMERKI